MPSLKDVRSKIAGVRKTKQITKAMNMVASAKLRGAQARIERFRAYADKFYTVLSDLADKAEGTAHPLLEVHPEARTTLIVLATSDRGLCGGFNAGLVARWLAIARQAQAESRAVKFLCVGKKGREAIRKNGYELLSSYVDVLGDFDFTLASAIGKEVISEYTSGRVDKVVLLYGRFESVARQVPTVLPLLPVQSHQDGHGETVDKGTAEYTYEPDVGTLLGVLLPRFVNVQIYRSLRHLRQ